MHIKCYVYKALHSCTSPLTGSMGYEHTQSILASVPSPTQECCPSYDFEMQYFALECSVSLLVAEIGKDKAGESLHSLAFVCQQVVSVHCIAPAVTKGPR